MVDAPPPPPPPPPPVRASRRRMAAAVAGGVALAVLVGGAVGFLTRPGAGPGPEPAAVTPAPTAPPSQALAAFRAAVTATRAAPGFHYVSQTSGAATQRIVGDAGRASGRQVITFDSSYGAEQFTLLLLNQSVYFQGNTPAIEDQLGVAAARAPALRNRWVSVVIGDGPYTVLQPGITVADQAQEMTLIPRSVGPVTEADGVRGLRISGLVPGQAGTAAGTAHLDVVASTHVPIAYVSSIAGSGSSVASSTVFSAWGTAPVVTAPSSAVPWSTLGAVQPPGGYGSGGGGGGTAPPSPGSV